MQLLGPVELLPPSRDDDDVASLKREGMKRAKVDGYGVPVSKQAWSLLSFLAHCLLVAVRCWQVSALPNPNQTGMPPFVRHAASGPEDDPAGPVCQLLA